MFPKELAIYACRRGRAFPDRLLRQTHSHYIRLAERILRLYGSGQGKRRSQLHREVGYVFQDEDDCPPQRVRALIRLLDRRSEYDTASSGDACRLRQRVFDLAAARHPLVVEPDALFQSRERDVKRAIAEQIGASWSMVDAQLYADLPEFHRLRKFDSYATPEALLGHYNMAQAQTLLIWAEEMTVLVQEDFRRLFRFAKLNRLMHEAEHAGSGAYRIRLTGPASVLQQTRRYGVNLAAFLPGLLSCRKWAMSARLRLPSGIAKFDLSPRDRLGGPGCREAVSFDSQVEEAFAEKFGPQRQDWQLQREGGFLVSGQKVFVPDFTFQHTDGTRVYLEIVGYWTPEYLSAKWQTLSLFEDAPIIVAVPKSTAAKTPALPAGVVTYATRLKIKPILEQLEMIRSKVQAQTQMSSDSTAAPP